jgi:hypothetical protein
MTEKQSRFFASFAGGTILVGIAMEKLFGYNNVLLALGLGLLLAYLVNKSTTEKEK